MAKFYVSILIGLSILCCLSHAQPTKIAEQYTTNKQRTQTVAKYCSKSRSGMISEQANSGFDFYGSLTQGEVGLNGELTIKYLIQGQWEKGLDETRGNARVWLYFIIFAIFLAIFIVMAPFLVCCCLCPNSCPPCAKLRHQKNQPYSNFQICCPPALIVLLSLIIIGCMIASLVFGVHMQKAYNKAECTFAIFLDDTINGNVTIDQKSYFIGLQPIKNSLTTINSSLSDIKQKIEPVSSSGTKIAELNSLVGKTQTKIKNLPNGAGGNLILQYNSPIDSQIPTTKINSNFPSVLGNSSTPLTLTGNASNGLLAASKSVQVVSLAADKVQTSIPKFQTSINKSVNTADTYLTSIKDINKKIDNSLTDIQQNYLKRVAIGFYIIVSLLILFGFLMLVSTICVCKGRYFCRKIIYVACIFLFLLGILAFLLSILFSGVTLVSFFGCQYLKTGMSSPALFQQYFYPLIRGVSTTKILSQCIPTGSGDILKQVIGIDSYNMLMGMGNLTSSLGNYNSDQVLEIYSSSYANLSRTIQNYERARVLDIDSQSDDAVQLQIVSNASNFACSTVGFSQDSWIPSVEQNPSYVNCKVSNGALVTNSSCTNFSSKDTGCVGCFDTYAVFQQNSTSAQVSAALLSRYPNTDCAQFRSSLTNIWNNFYRTKKQVIGPVLSRSIAVQEDMTNIKTKLMDIKPIFSLARSNLQSTFSSIFDNKYGLLAGLNCRVLGEDINLIIEVGCNGIFVYSYLLRIMFITTSFAIFFIMMLVVCVIVRSRSTQRRQNSYSQQIELESEKELGGTANSQGSKDGRNSRRKRRSIKSTNSAQQLNPIQF